MTIMKRDDPEENDDMRFEKIIDRPRAFDSFEDAVEHLKAINKCSGTEALRKAREGHPGLFEAYQKAGAVSSRPNFEKAATPLDVQRFDKIVDGIMGREGVSRLRAMQIASRTEPEAFERFQSA